MSLVKVIEVIAESEKSFDDAAKMAFQQSSKTIKNIKSIYIDNMKVMVENDNITSYRVNAKVSFVLEGKE